MFWTTRISQRWKHQLHRRCCFGCFFLQKPSQESPGATPKRSLKFPGKLLSVSNHHGDFRWLQGWFSCVMLCFLVMVLPRIESLGCTVHQLQRCSVAGFFVNGFGKQKSWGSHDPEISSSEIRRKLGPFYVFLSVFLWMIWMVAV